MDKVAYGGDDTTLRRAVCMEIAADPTISSQSQIRVEATNGIVLLEGIVPHAHAAERAVAAARRTAGVRGVIERFRVRFAVCSELSQGGSRAERRSDADIQREVLAQLRKDAALEAAQLTVRVAAGRVILTGEVGSSHERCRARARAWVAGVQCVEDDVVVRAASGSRFKVARDSRE